MRRGGDVGFKACLVTVLLICSLVFSSVYSTSRSQPESLGSKGISGIPFQEGWPQETTGEILSSPVVADLDGDGKQEIIVGSGGSEDKKSKCYVFHCNGSVMKGWPKTLVRWPDVSPSVGDLDGDGDLEVVMGTYRFVYVWHHDGSLMDGWPKSVDFLTAASTLYDVDGDGDLEVIVGSNEHANSTSYAMVSIWHHNGTNLRGWPRIVTEHSPSYVTRSSPAVGDIDGDGDVEIIVGIRTGSEPYNGYVYAWHSNGKLVDGWPVSTGQFGDVISSPAVGDIDGDGDLEVVVGSNNGSIWAFSSSGEVVSGWPQPQPPFASWIRHQALGDVDQDGMLEIVSGTVDGRSVYVWNGDGSLLRGWPGGTEGFIYSSPVVADIAGDEYPEVIASSCDHRVYAWYLNGSLVPDFPLETGDEIYSTPCVSDIDGDGDVEIIVGSCDKCLYVWDLLFPYKRDGMEWPMFQHDPYHTGLYTFDRGFCVDANGPYYVMVNKEFQLFGSVIGGTPPYSWYWEFGDGTTSSERNPVHVYNEIGTYTVNLTVVDSMGNTVSDSDKVYVSLYGKDWDGALKIKTMFGGVGVTVVVENKAAVKARGVKWCFCFENKGDMVFPPNGKLEGRVSIPAGGSRIIWCPTLSLRQSYPLVIFSVEIDDARDSVSRWTTIAFSVFCFFT